MNKLKEFLSGVPDEFRHALEARICDPDRLHEYVIELNKNIRRYKRYDVNTTKTWFSPLSISGAVLPRVSLEFCMVDGASGDRKLEFLRAEIEPVNQMFYVNRPVAYCGSVGPIRPILRADGMIDKFLISHGWEL